MSGRHRKQSETGNVAGKAALSGLALTGAGMWFASAANAATDDQWDRVAACESGNNWKINTGNGYQGGLQFNPSTWLSHGGGQYSPAANLATREQQIAIAEKVLATQGRGAWPVCGRGLGAATPREAVPGPKAPERVQPNHAPDAVAVANVEKDATSNYDALAVGQAHITQAAFADINEAMQIGMANDLRAPAPEQDPAEDADAPEAEAPDADTPEAQPVADAQSDDNAPAEEAQASEDASSFDDLGEFVLAAKAKGFNLD